MGRDFAYAMDPRQGLFLAMSGGHRHGHRGWGGPGRRGGPPFGPPFGPPWGGRGRGRGPRARRGDVRAALLALLAEEPRNGYQLMQEIERRSDGLWRPSPGSVYPALQQLEDEGLVVAEAIDGGRRFTLTDAGRGYVEEHAEQIGRPWDAVKEDQGEGAAEMRTLVWQVGAAVMQVVQAGTAAQIDEARKVLADTRRRLYRILAEDEPADEAGEAPPEA
jgi:DNA-binding PadR family transcriptional regulator